jgi:hypothetical protein
VLDNGEPSSIFSFQAFDGVSAKPGPYATMMNDITYGGYHMSRAESHLMPGVRRDVDESSPGSGSPR